MGSFRVFFLLILMCSLVSCFEDDMLSLEEDHQKAPSLKAAGLQSPSLQRFAELVKRGKFQQFYGLMGKRTREQPDWVGPKDHPAQCPVCPQWAIPDTPEGGITTGHPGEKFIGLMGRRYSRGESTADGDNSQPVLAGEP